MRLHTSCEFAEKVRFWLILVLNAFRFNKLKQYYYLETFPERMNRGQLTYFCQNSLEFYTAVCVLNKMMKICLFKPLPQYLLINKN
jgi:hypothetical protein